MDVPGFSFCGACQRGVSLWSVRLVLASLLLAHGGCSELACDEETTVLESGTFTVSPGNWVAKEGATAELSGTQLEIRHSNEDSQWRVVFQIQTEIRDREYDPGGYAPDPYCAPGPGTAELIEVERLSGGEDADRTTLWWARFVGVCPSRRYDGFELVEQRDCSGWTWGDPAYVELRREG